MVFFFFLVVNFQCETGEVRTVKPIIFKDSYYTAIEKEINAIWYRWIYGKLLSLVADYSRNELQNAVNDALYTALAHGRLDYDQGIIYGNTNAAISKILKSLGAKYNARSNTWSIQQLPPIYSFATAAAASRYQKLRQTIVNVLDNADIERSVAESKIQGSFYDTINNVESVFQQTMRGVTIQTIMTYDQKIALSHTWTENLKIYIKKWSNDNILKLRQEVLSNVTAGNRFGSLVSTIQANYQVSRNKAKFLARQETSLAVANMRQQRYADAGVVSYRWSSSGDERVRLRHKELNGKIFQFSDPPMSGENGEPGNPGEPFGCRCTPIPILPGEEQLSIVD